MPIIDNQDVGNRIKQIRINGLNKRFTQIEFGDLFTPPVQRTAIKNWENGLNLPNNERLKQIAEIGGVTTDYLLFGKQNSGYGNRIKQLRKSANMTEEDFANRFNRSFRQQITEQTVKDWENENLLPTFDQLTKISQLSFTSLFRLLYGDEFAKESDKNVYAKLDHVEYALNTELDSQQKQLFDEMFFIAEDLRLVAMESGQKRRTLKALLDEIKWFTGSGNNFQVRADETGLVTPISSLEEKIEVHEEKAIDLIKQLSKQMLEEKERKQRRKDM